MAAVIPLIKIISTLLSVGGQLASAGAERKRGAEEQKIYEERADKAIVEGQQTMLKERHRTDLVASRALALSSASGASPTDPTALNIIGDIKGEGAYRESVAMYAGEEDARILRMGGKIAREEAEAKATAREFGAASTALTGGASLYAKYGAKKPPPVSVSKPTYTFERGY